LIGDVIDGVTMPTLEVVTVNEVEPPPAVTVTVVVVAEVADDVCLNTNVWPDVAYKEVPLDGTAPNAPPATDADTVSLLVK